MSSTPSLPYESPTIEDVGDLMELTADKSGSSPDFLSGTDPDNCAPRCGIPSGFP